jgi:predicted Zn-dependent protease
LAILGSAYMADGKPELALQQFQKAAALDPDNPALKIQVGISEVDAGQGERGIVTLEQVFGTEAGAPIAGPALVVTEVRAHRFDKAAEVATSLVQRDAKNPIYQTLLGEVRMAQQDYPAAETAFRAAVALNPDLNAATLDLARVYAAMGRVDDARNLYNGLLAKKSVQATALLGLADVYISQQKWTEAIDAINQARTAAQNDPTPGLKLVELYETREDWTNAKAVAAELATQFPGNAKILDAEGQVQLAAGDAIGASSSFKRAYELAPNSAPILSRYIAALRGAKYFTEAHGVLQEAVARDPQNPSLKVDLIQVEAEINGVDAAAAKARAFATDDPKNIIYDLTSAELYERAGRIPDALAVLEKASAANASDENLTTALARLYNRSGDFRKAEDVLASRLRTDPKNITIGTAMARQYLVTGRAQDAKKLFAELLEQQPNNGVILRGLADIATTEQNWVQAVDYLNRARAAEPTNPAPGIALVNLQLSRRDWPNAVATANQIAGQFPANIEVLDAKGRAQIASGDNAGALAIYKRIYELSPGSIPATARYVALLREAKEFSQAQTVLQAALARDPKSDQVKGDLVRVEADIGGMRAGLAKAHAFAAEDPDNPFYYILSAELYEKAGRQDDAIDLLARAVAERPSDDALIAALSGLYTRVGDAGKAEAVLKARLKADPADVAIRAVMASLYLKQKRYDEAFAEYTRVVAEHPADAAALNNLAWLYQQKGDLVKARQLAERAFADDPQEALVRDTLGWILVAQGEADKALTYLGTASLSAPTNPDIQYHLAVALNTLGRTADAQTLLETLLGSGATFSDRAEAEKLLQQLKRG